MKLKMKLMAAAVALTAATGANAAMDLISGGNSSLAFIAVDSTGNPISMMMDLDFRLGATANGFLPSYARTSTPGTTTVWNFNNNTLTIDGVLQTGRATNWSSAFSTFASTAQAAETKWGVIAGDSSGTDVRYLTTSNTPLATLQTQTQSSVSSMAGVNDLYNGNNLIQTVASGLNGSTASSGSAYVGNPGSFGTAGNWKNNFVGDAFAAEGQSAEFYFLNNTPGVPTTVNSALVTPYAGNFTYAAGVLTYAVAPIPEPETYALLLAGLGMLGFMGRRRLSNRV